MGRFSLLGRSAMSCACPSAEARRSACFLKRLVGRFAAELVASESGSANVSWRSGKARACGRGGARHDDACSACRAGEELRRNNVCSLHEHELSYGPSTCNGESFQLRRRRRGARCLLVRDRRSRWRRAGQMRLSEGLLVPGCAASRRAARSRSPVSRAEGVRRRDWRAGGDDALRPQIA